MRFFLLNKQRQFQFITILFLCIVSACNNTGTQNSNTGKDTATGKAKSTTQAAAFADINPTLYTLYLNNTAADPELKNLLDETKGHEDIVLLFYHVKGKPLTLGAWPSKKGYTDFDKNNVILLTNTMANGIDITGSTVYLGNQQIPSDVIKKIKRENHINKQGEEYILFQPAIDETDVNHSFIYYNIVTSNSPAAVPVVPIVLGSTKPSPPYSPI